MSHHCELCGAPLGKKHSGRSYDQHKRFFAVSLVALKHWPEEHRLQPSDIEECRKYLVMRAGWYYEAHRVFADGMDPGVLAETLEGAFRAAGQYSIAGQRDGDAIVWAPKSISYDEMSHAEACHIFGRVDEVVIPDLFGCNGEELLQRDLEAA